MRVQRLTLKNFRGFADLDLTFSEQVTVLVGINGAGKTSILDAIASALSRVNDAPVVIGQDRSDFRNGTRDLTIRLEIVTLQGSYSIPLTIHCEASIHPSTESVKNEGHRSPGNLQVPTYALAHYPVDRSVRHHAPPSPDQPSLKHAALIEINEVDFSVFFDWYEQREDLENEAIREKPEHRDAELEAVRRSIETMLPGFSKPRVRRAPIRKGHAPEPSKLIVTKGDITLDIGQLSHGERGLLAMAGDIARRLALAGPETVEPRLRAGVVLIDEVDLHLHPQWQREVLARLTAAFPNVQFIVTTHSPQVIAQLRPESVKLFKNFALVPTPPTYGRDTNAILADVMGVAEFPAFSEAWRRDIARLIDEERWTDARAELARMADAFGALDREVVRLRTLIDVLDGSREAAK